MALTLVFENDKRECSTGWVDDNASRSLVVSLSRAYEEIAFFVRGPENMGRPGIQPERLNEVLAALRERREATFLGQFWTRPFGAIVERKDTFIKIRPRPNGKLTIMAADMGNPTASITLTHEQIDAFVASVERLLEVEPHDVAYLREQMQDTFEQDEFIKSIREEGAGRPRFSDEHPNIREEVEGLIAAKRYAAAEKHYMDTYLGWSKRHPVDPSKMAATPQGQEALKAIVDALRKPL